MIRKKFRTVIGVLFVITRMLYDIDENASRSTMV